jgi:2-polyprenyl-3-methyl-5-hydroxy-6-metoxy-1,4-benzoquinol methylase
MKNQYKIISDPEYGYLRADPIPSKQEVERYYQEEFYSAKRFNDSSLEVQSEGKNFYDSRWERIYQYCKEFFGEKKFSLFDIGFGYAQALLYFNNKGIEVSGLDPAPQGVHYARDQGLDVYQAGIEDFSCVGERRFDVVMLLNVLEHLRHPQDILKSIQIQLLKPGGLLIIEVPNEFNDFQMAAVAEHELKEWWVCPPHHLNYFSTTSLKQLLEKSGYEVVHAQSTFPMEIFLLMGEIYVGDSALGKQCHLKREKFEEVLRRQGKGEKLLRFYEALAQMDLGRQALVFAKHPKI